MRAFSIFLFLLYSLLAVQISGQKTENNGKSIVEYFDGSVFVGVLLTQTGVQQEMVISTGDTLNLNFNLIKKIRRAEDIFLLNKRRFHLKSGYVSNFSYGQNGGTNSYGVSMDLGFSKRIKPNLNLGVGFGIHYAQHSFRVPGQFNRRVWTDANLLPIYLSSQYYFNEKRVRPYALGKIGFASSLQNRFSEASVEKGGFHGRFGLGIELASRKKTRAYFEFYQYLQKVSGFGVSFGEFGQPISYAYDIFGKRLGFSMGLRF